ncbi:MAG: hypothetical protein NC218_10820 [Acetobacter sp.]|nr:hypothetical protein [Acetobacter sp.]
MWELIFAYILGIIVGLVLIFTEISGLIILTGEIILFGGTLFIILQILHNVCYPDEILKLDNGQVKVCVYKSQTLHKHNLFELIIHKGDKELLLCAAEYAFPFKNPDAVCFTFRPAQDADYNWFVWNVQTEETTVLGSRLNKILFISPKEGESLRVPCANGNVQVITGEYIVYDQCHITAGSTLRYADNGKNPQIPDKFLFVRQDGIYKSYGFYLREDKPECREIILSSAIFREGRDRILLQYDEDKECYHELFRCVEIFRSLDEYFAELTEDYHIGGNIYRYNGKLKKLEKIYEGNFRCIDYDNGQILGDDEKIYGHNGA